MPPFVSPAPCYTGSSVAYQLSPPIPFITPFLHLHFRQHLHLQSASKTSMQSHLSHLRISVLDTKSGGASASKNTYRSKCTIIASPNAFGSSHHNLMQHQLCIFLLHYTRFSRKKYSYCTFPEADIPVGATIQLSQLLNSDDR